MSVFQDVVLSTDLDNRVKRLAKATRNAKLNNAPFRHALVIQLFISSVWLELILLLLFVTFFSFLVLWTSWNWKNHVC